MHDLINKGKKNEGLINNLFVPNVTEKQVKKTSVVKQKSYYEEDEDEDYYRSANLEKDVFISRILTIKDGYGFIKNEPDNAFFHYTSLIDFDFNELEVGDKVQYRLEITDEGKTVAKEIIVLNGLNSEL